MGSSVAVRGWRCSSSAARTCGRRHQRRLCRLSQVAPSAVRSPLVSSLSPAPSDLPAKFRAAFEVFFPSTTREGQGDARGEAKRRLRMVLVADRSAMTEETLQRMKDSIVEAVSSYVEIDGGARKVQVQWNQDSELGTIYSVSVPVVRVLSQGGAGGGAQTLSSEERALYDPLEQRMLDDRAP